MIFTAGAANVQTSDLYDWSAANAADCTAVTPSTAFAAANANAAFAAAVATPAGLGVYKLCVRATGGTDSVAQSGATLTVVGK